MGNIWLDNLPEEAAQTKKKNIWLDGPSAPKKQNPIQKVKTEIKNKKETLKSYKLPTLDKSDDRNIVEKALNTPKNTGFLGDLFDVLSRGQYASANVAKALVTGNDNAGSAALKGLKGDARTSYSDVLDEAGMEEGWKRSALGFAGDVLLDPTTYLTFGTGAAAKTGLKGTAKGLGKLPKLLGKEAIDRGGLKFAGLSLVPQTVVDKGLQKTGITKAANIARDSKIGQVMGKAFVSNFREVGTDKNVWDKFIDIKKDYQNTLAYSQKKVVDDAVKLGKGLSKEERELITLGLQNPLLLKGQRKEVIDAARAARKVFKEIGREEVDLGLLKKARKNYVPGIYPEKGKVSLEGLAPGSQLRASIGKHKKAKKFDTLQEAINAGLKPETDIAKLVGIRDVVSKRATTTQRFIDDVVNQFGQKVKAKDIDNLPDNMGVYLPKGALKFFPQDTVNLLKANAKGDLIEVPLDALRKGMGVSKNVPMVALPKQIAGELNNFKKAAWDEGTKGFVKYAYDMPLNLWKAYATATNPGFHIRNALSNAFQTYLNNPKALNPKNLVKTAAVLGSDTLPLVGKRLGNKTISVGGKNMTRREVKELMKKEGVLNQGWFSKELVPDYIQNELNDRVGDIKLTSALNAVNPFSQKNLLISGGRAVGQGVENQARAMNFLADVKKTGDVKQAAKNVDKYLFDYGDLTDFEKNYARRAIPFYTWLRKNIPLQAEQLAKQPGKYAAVPKAINAVEENTPETDEKYLPEYMENWVRTPFTQGGNPLYWNPNMPYGDLDKLNPLEAEKTVLGSMTPMAKVPIELATNRNFFFKSPIERYEGQLVDAPAYMPKLPKSFRDAIGAKMVKDKDTGEYKLKIPAKMRYLTKQVPFAENVSRAIEYKDDKLLNHLLSFLLGAKIAPYDYEKGKTNALYQERQDYRDYFDKLEDEGVLPEDYKQEMKKTTQKKKNIWLD